MSNELYIFVGFKHQRSPRYHLSILFSMSSTFHGEQWKAVPLPEGIINETRIEVSNFGRVRSFNKISNGNIIRGSLTEGYPTIRMKLYLPKNENDEAVVNVLRSEVTVLQKELKTLKAAKANEAEIEQLQQSVLAAKKKLQKKSAAILKKRTVYFQALIHRMVADHFLPKPSEDYKFVGHMDFDKLNNNASNLKWLTKEEHLAHREKNPAVIKQLAERNLYPERHATTKLSVTKVMLLKKLLNENKSMKALSKQFKITETQVLRIKRGENWKNVPAYDPGKTN